MGQSSKKLRVAILFGGQSGEHEISIVSARSVANALDSEKYEVILVGIDKKGRWLLPDKSKILLETNDLRAVRLNQEENSVVLSPYPSQSQWMAESGNLNNIDVVLPILHGPKGEDGSMQGLLELASIPYVGSGVLGSSVCMDKDFAKRLLIQSGLSVVDFLTVKKSDYDADPESFIQKFEEKFSYPYFVKPANMGSSVGVEKIKNKEEAKEKIKNAFQYDRKLIAEKAIVGRELECAVLGNHDPKASCIGEIVPKHDFYSYESKYVDQDGADLIIPAKDLDEKIIQKIQEDSIKAFQALECRGMARVDFFLEEKTNKIYINELNTIPGFTSISQYPKLWEASGLSYSKLLDRLIELAKEEYQDKQSLRISYFE